MIKRNRKPLDVIWLHLDATHVAYPAAIAAMRVMHERMGDFNLSVNLSDDGTEALVKVAGALPGWATGKAWAAVVKNIFTAEDHAQAVLLTKNILWEPLLQDGV